MALQLDGAERESLSLSTPLSGEPLWLGDFPGDDNWGARYNIHPAMTGTLTVRVLGGR